MVVVVTVVEAAPPVWGCCTSFQFLYMKKASMPYTTRAAKVKKAVAPIAGYPGALTAATIPAMANRNTYTQ